MSHAITRTSPKGGPFIGRCIKCGADGLGMGAPLENCPADGLVSDEHVLTEMLSSRPLRPLRPLEPTVLPGQMGSPEYMAERQAALIGWLRNPWAKCDNQARGPIPEWCAALMFEAANVIESLIIQVSADITTQRSDVREWAACICDQMVKDTLMTWPQKKAIHGAASRIRATSLPQIGAKP